MHLIINHKIIVWLYSIGMIGTCIGMPWSNVIMSVGSIWVLCVWLIELLSKNYRRKCGEIIAPPVRNKWVFAVLFSIVLIHLLGLLHTSDFHYALNDLRKKLPLLLFPVVLYTMTPLPFAMWNWLKRLFTSALFLAVIVCFLKNWGYWNNPEFDVRSLSVFTSHIRFSLMLNLGMLILFDELRKKRFPLLLGVIYIAAYLIFMWEVQSITGLGLVFVLSLYIVWDLFQRKGRPRMKMAFTLSISLALLMAGLFIADAYRAHYSSSHPPFSLNKTRDGNDFECELNKRYRESGNLVYCHFNRYEMSVAWEERSEIPFTGQAQNGGLISATLMRYMTAIHAIKDREGVAGLSNEDIKAVEQGITNPKMLEANAIRRRLDELFFEMDALNSGDDPSGKSFIQRLEYWKTALHIIQKHPWIGVGTGDVSKAFKAQYIEDNSPLEEKFRLRSHQQFLSFWVAFGVLGPLILLLVLVVCWKKVPSENRFVALGFLLIAYLSFLTEDTLETQAGVTFFSFFISLFFLWPIANLPASNSPLEQ